MITISVDISGAKELKVYMDGVKKRAREEPPKTAFRLAKKTQRLISSTIKSEQRWIGTYRKLTGTGLADSLRTIKTGKASYRVMPDPAQAAISTASSGIFGGKGFVVPPNVYANFVEYGHNSQGRSVSGRFYFEKGLRKALPLIDLETERTLQKITKLNIR